MEINIDEKAPDFTLRAHDKSMVSLHDYRGQNVVLLFFPLAFTSVCTTELCSMRDHLADYEALNAKVFAISVDSLYTLKHFRETNRLNFPLLSDFNKETSRSYGTLHEEFGYGMKGVAKRSVFVIDGQGVIRHKEILEVPSELPNFDVVRDTLANI